MTDRIIETLKNRGYALHEATVLAKEIANNLKDYAAREDSRYYQVLEFRLHRARASK